MTNINMTPSETITNLVMLGAIVACCLVILVNVVMGERISRFDRLSFTAVFCLGLTLLCTITFTVGNYYPI